MPCHEEMVTTIIKGPLPSERLRQITRKIAALPTQNIKQSDHRFKDMTHPRLPIRSLEENCSHVNQYRRWVNDKPTRSTEVADKMLQWVDHFEASKVVPIYTITLDADSLEVTCWWRYFLIEIGILSAQNRLNLLRTQENEEDGRGKSNVTSTLVKIKNTYEKTYLMPC